VTTLAISGIPDAKLKSEAKTSMKEQVDRLDLPGYILWANMITMLLLALDWRVISYAWNSATRIGLFCAAVCPFFAFLFWKYREGEAAMLPLRVFRKYTVCSAAAAGVMSYSGLYVIITYLPLFPSRQRRVPTHEWSLLSAIRLYHSLGYCIQRISRYVFTTASQTSIRIPRLTVTVPKCGYCAPFMIFGAAIAAIAPGLMSTITPTASTAAWVGYQLINGIARGMMSQQHIIATQASLPKNDLSIGTALIVFCQNFGGSVFISLGQTTFENSLLPAPAKFAPEVDAENVASAGATDLSSMVPAPSVP
jgi:hypothetical protein